MLVDNIKVTPCTKVILIIPLMYRTHLSAGAGPFFPTNAGYLCDKPPMLVDKIKVTPCTKVILIIPLMYRTHLLTRAGPFFPDKCRILIR